MHYCSKCLQTIRDYIFTLYLSTVCFDMRDRFSITQWWFWYKNIWYNPFPAEFRGKNVKRKTWCVPGGHLGVIWGIFGTKNDFSRDWTWSGLWNLVVRWGQGCFMCKSQHFGISANLLRYFRREMRREMAILRPFWPIWGYIEPQNGICGSPL